jgi:hypothetical protein
MGLDRRCLTPLRYREQTGRARPEDGAYAKAQHVTALDPRMLIRPLASTPFAATPARTRGEPRIFDATPAPTHRDSRGTSTLGRAPVCCSPGGRARASCGRRSRVTEGTQTRWGPIPRREAPWRRRGRESGSRPAMHLPGVDHRGLCRAPRSTGVDVSPSAWEPPRRAVRRSAVVVAVRRCWSRSPTTPSEAWSR